MTGGALSATAAEGCAARVRPAVVINVMWVVTIKRVLVGPATSLPCRVELAHARTELRRVAAADERAVPLLGVDAAGWILIHISISGHIAALSIVHILPVQREVAEEAAHTLVFIAATPAAVVVRPTPVLPCSPTR